MGTRNKKDRVKHRRERAIERELFDRSRRALREANLTLMSGLDDPIDSSSFKKNPVSNAYCPFHTTERNVYHPVIDQVVFTPIGVYDMPNPGGVWTRTVPTFISASIIACAMLLSLAIFN